MCRGYVATCVAVLDRNQNIILSCISPSLTCYSAELLLKVGLIRVNTKISDASMKHV